ncbi:hypothetical protein AN642_02535 [Epulopiscium sp. SCG-B10WGA-EpuloA2]|nr:hypothetical protein AN642_02535 [Epulopiscium sp. SCG-B10WGA-EpuloA2]
MIKIKNGYFSLQTIISEYVFCIDNEGLVRHLYWGKIIDCLGDFKFQPLTEISTNDPVYEITPEEYPVYGGLRYKESCLKVTFADGTRDICYKYTGYDIKDSTLIIKLTDIYYNLSIELYYKVYEDCDLIERWTVVSNNSADALIIDEIYSAQYHLPYENLRFSNTHGHWGAEQQAFTQNVSYGKICFENRRGISGHNHNPYFILENNATETTGDVFFGVLKFSGNFRGIVEQTQYGETLVQMGLNPYDCKIVLQANEKFTTPSILAGYSNLGFEEMTYIMQLYNQEHVLTQDLRPVLYNSWEAVGFDVTCDKQQQLAKLAQDIGAELFVVDDGWFGNRNGIDNGLGDWYVNETKFPNGLQPLIDTVKNYGMKFGIWVEPEMVNPQAQLYKDHPDWIYRFDNREVTTSREQCVLNMTNKEVQDFVYNMLDDLLSNYDISYIKWDANRPISEPGAKNLGQNEQMLWYLHIEAVYNIINCSC